MKPNPLNYKTQNGLLRAITAASYEPMTITLAWWFRNARYAMIDNFGWDEASTDRYLRGYIPNLSKYKAIIENSR